MPSHSDGTGEVVPKPKSRVIRLSSPKSIEPFTEHTERTTIRTTARKSLISGPQDLSLLSRKPASPDIDVVSPPWDGSTLSADKHAYAVGGSSDAADVKRVPDNLMDEQGIASVSNLDARKYVAGQDRQVKKKGGAPKTLPLNAEVFEVGGLTDCEAATRMSRVALRVNHRWAHLKSILYPSQ